MTRQSRASQVVLGGAQKSSSPVLRSHRGVGEPFAGLAVHLVHGDICLTEAVPDERGQVVELVFLDPHDARSGFLGVDLLVVAALLAALVLVMMTVIPSVRDGCGHVPLRERSAGHDRQP